MIDKTGYKEVIEHTLAKHAWKGQIVQTVMFRGDTSGDMYRVTEIQDKPYKVRVMSLFFEDEHASMGFEPREHYLHADIPCTIYVEHEPKKQTL
jgi:hypothetical protein